MNLLAGGDGTGKASGVFWAAEFLLAGNDQQGSRGDHDHEAVEIGVANWG